MERKGMKKLIVSITLLMVLLAGYAVAGESSEKSTDSDDSDKKKEAVAHYNNGLDHMDKAKQILIVGDSAFAYNYRATSDAKAKKEYEKAVMEFNTAIDIQPDMKEAYNNLGFCYRKLGKLEMSLKMYERALKFDPDFAQAREYLGETYLAMEDLDKANEQLIYLQKLESPYADTLAHSIKSFKLNQVNQKIKK